MLGESQRGRQALARRFECEACDTAALGSIHTIEVYDFGVTEEGDCPQTSWSAGSVLTTTS